MADVFISYKRVDIEKARALAYVLGGYGYSVWWDVDLLPGDKYDAIIAEIIRTSRAALVLWSPQSVTSDYVLDEARRAREGKKLVPLRIDSAPLPMGFGSIHTHDLDGWNGQEVSPIIEPLLRAIENMVGRPRGEFSPEAGQAAAGSASKAKPPPPVDQRQAAALRRWIDDFLWPLLYVVGLFLLASTIAFLIPGKPNYVEMTREAVKLVHIYAGMIILGGGVFVMLLFRIAARAITRPERLACAEAGRKLVLFVWLPTAMMQPLLGLAMLYVKYNFTLKLDTVYFPRWIVLSLVLYAAALLSWGTGFRSSWEAAQSDASYGDPSTLHALQFKRDVLLGVALGCTIAVYSLMVYHEQFQLLFTG